MSSILKRSLVVAAIVGVGVVPSSAMAHHDEDNTHNPPGQACAGMTFGGEDDQYANKGECASAVAKANKEARNAPDEPAE